jgi:hypothetical protein
MIPKYLSRKGNHNNIYHYYTVDKSKPIIILEGPIDSEFVKNSIAMTGVKLQDNRLKDFPNKYFLIDNDSTPDTQKKKIELLISGEYVFCWKWFINDFKLPKREKWDINDVCIYLNKSEYCFDELQKYFTNSIYDKIYFI